MPAGFSGVCGVFSHFATRRTRTDPVAGDLIPLTVVAKGRPEIISQAESLQIFLSRLHN